MTMIEDIAPIELDELIARAALLTRVDRKYLLTTTDLPDLLRGLPDDTRVLEIGDRREFGYESLYLDTPDLACYLAATRQRRRRFKLRIRRYVDADQRYLEVKVRGRRSTVVKHRVPHEAEDTVDADAATRLLARVGPRWHPEQFTAQLHTSYHRTTLFLPASASRVTVDTGLRWELVDGGAVRLPRHIIVETKSSHGSSEVDRLLWSLRHRPCAVSKYATGLAALRPELPAHRWQPVLRACALSPTPKGTDR